MAACAGIVKVSSCKEHLQFDRIIRRFYQKSIFCFMSEIKCQIRFTYLYFRLRTITSGSSGKKTTNNHNYYRHHYHHLQHHHRHHHHCDNHCHRHHILSSQPRCNSSRLLLIRIWFVVRGNISWILISTTIFSKILSRLKYQENFTKGHEVNI